ncbi:hypothetical protein [Blastopirellula retiformator]|uniref:Lipoprotein n=1 Tax=Blastopirellula retiformator TaxID=2527970 RepID=A0A5C5V3P1_9BACT|nr:hypothetical protein [Blastopirellula retiformator]TWT32640.1 hypothetical protein Enr8_24450 [Blastopirellula retiformator]
MKKITFTILMLMLLPMLSGCAACDWLLGGIADNYYGAANRTERWQNSTGHEFQQSDFQY